MNKYFVRTYKGTHTVTCTSILEALQEVIASGVPMGIIYAVVDAAEEDR